MRRGSRLEFRREICHRLIVTGGKPPAGEPLFKGSNQLLRGSHRPPSRGETNEFSHTCISRARPHIQGSSSSQIRIVHALVAVGDLPKDIPLEPDPRVPKISGPIIGRISESPRSNDGRFHLLNRGITISVHGVEFDNRRKILKLQIPEKDAYGIIDVVLRTRPSMLSSPKRERGTAVLTQPRMMSRTYSKTSLSILKS